MVKCQSQCWSLLLSDAGMPVTMPVLFTVIKYKYNKCRWVHCNLIDKIQLMKQLFSRHIDKLHGYMPVTMLVVIINASGCREKSCFINCILSSKLCTHRHLLYLYFFDKLHGHMPITMPITIPVRSRTYLKKHVHIYLMGGTQGRLMFTTYRTCVDQITLNMRPAVRQSCSSMSTYLQHNKTQKRKRGRKPMVDGELDSARAVTHTKVTVINDDGTVDVKRVLESLDTPKPKFTTDPKRSKMPDRDYEMVVL